MMQHVAPVHIRTTLVSGATIIEQFLFIDICTFAMISLMPGSDGSMGLHAFNLTAVDPKND